MSVARFEKKWSVNHCDSDGKARSNWACKLAYGCGRVVTPPRKLKSGSQSTIREGDKDWRRLDDHYGAESARFTFRILEGVSRI
jgi:hypothetical protein